MSKKSPNQKPLTDAQFSRLLCRVNRNLISVEKALAQQEQDLKALEADIENVQRWGEHLDDDPPDFDYDMHKPQQPLKPVRVKRQPCLQEHA